MTQLVRHAGEQAVLPNIRNFEKFQKTLDNLLQASPSKASNWGHSHHDHITKQTAPKSSTQASHISGFHSGPKRDASSYKIKKSTQYVHASPTNTASKFEPSIDKSQLGP